MGGSRDKIILKNQRPLFIRELHWNRVPRSLSRLFCLSSLDLGITMLPIQSINSFHWDDILLDIVC